MENANWLQMKVDSLNIDKQALIRLIKDQFEIRPVAALRFVPLGEESYSYILETLPHTYYFVKVQEPSPDMQTRYEAANMLYTQCKHAFVVHPYKTLNQNFYAKMGEYTVAVFDYVEGKPLGQSGFDPNDWQQAANLTALLHQSVQCPSLPSLPEERFEIWFEDWLLKVLDAIENPTPLNNEIEYKTRKLLILEKNNIEQTLDRLKELVKVINLRSIDMVLTHGDMNPGNIIKDRKGDLHVIDWSKLAIGPPERDLVNFMGDHFEMFLKAYVGSNAQTPMLHPELIEFYYYFLILWGIADYGSWILLEDAVGEEKAFVWKQLQQLLPIQHKLFQIDKVKQAINRVI